MAHFSSVTFDLTWLTFILSNSSGRYYRFGGNVRDSIKYVEKQDVPWFLDIREDGVQLFRRYTAPAEAAKPDAIVAPLGDLTVKVQRIVEDDKPDPNWKDKLFKDPATLTVAQIKELALSADDWKTLAYMESTGKNRVTVLEWADAKQHE